MKREFGGEPGGSFVQGGRQRLFHDQIFGHNIGDVFGLGSAQDEVKPGGETKGSIYNQKIFAPFGVQPPAIHFLPAIQAFVGSNAPVGYGI
ncbi:MAG: hypothetical protein G01um101416_265 [Microgenomates group bacterium Gr01-1014_16]|nr:MAG: hypothetical protein G01um101416_265 [Microgenomates group bacterium Gr01-1014_16]